MPSGRHKTLSREELQEALARHRGSVLRAAQELGVSRQTIYSNIEDYGIARRKLTAAERRASAVAAAKARWSKDGESSAA